MALDEVAMRLEVQQASNLPNIAPPLHELCCEQPEERLQSFEVISSTGQNVFANLNAVSQILSHNSAAQPNAHRGLLPPRFRVGRAPEPKDFPH